MTDSVWVLVHETRREGTSVTVYSNKEKLYDELYEYVKEHWDSDTSIPQKKKVAINQYFSGCDGETYYIENTTVR